MVFQRQTQFVFSNLMRKPENAETGSRSDIGYRG
jgi:hypothetical protein